MVREYRVRLNSIQTVDIKLKAAKGEMPQHIRRIAPTSEQFETLKQHKHTYRPDDDNEYHHKHTYAHKYFTDGSRMQAQSEDEELQYKTGVGVYRESTYEQDGTGSYVFEEDQPVLDAELMGIAIAIQQPAKQNE